MHYFIIGGDETCLMASDDGSCKVVGDAERKKHEKKTADCRASITLYRVGNAAGDTGPW